MKAKSKFKVGDRVTVIPRDKLKPNEHLNDYSVYGIINHCYDEFAGKTTKVMSLEGNTVTLKGDKTYFSWPEWALKKAKKTKPKSKTKNN